MEAFRGRDRETILGDGWLLKDPRGKLRQAAPHSAGRLGVSATNQKGAVLQFSGPSASVQSLNGQRLRPAPQG